jgi:hypothetical protein
LRLLIALAPVIVISSYLSVPAIAGEGVVVEVDTVEELYAEFYNPNNVGATIELAPGTYVLNASGPNGGRLVFGPGTAAAIKGQNEYFDIDGDGVPDPRDDNGDGEPDLDAAGKKIFANPATETIIDATSLSLSPTNTFAFIELRAQPNSIGTSQSVGNITLRGNNRPRGAIIVQGITNSVLDANITGCIIEDSPRGILIDARATNPAGQNAQLNVMAEGNVIRNSGVNNLPGVVFGWGVQTQQSTSGLKFSVDARHNRFYGNKTDLFLASLGAQDSTTSVVSQSNIYEEAVLTHDPVLGNIISAGIFILIRDNGNQSGSHRNQSHLISSDDAIWNNEGWGGVYAEIRRDSDDVEIMDNEINLELVGTRFVKLREDGTFDGLQNRDARTDPAKRRDLAILGLNDSGSNLPWPQPRVFTGPTFDNKVKVKIKEATTSLMRTDYDKKPQPFAVFDNAPDQVEVELELEEINFGL